MALAEQPLCNWRRSVDHNSPCLGCDLAKFLIGSGLPVHVPGCLSELLSRVIARVGQTFDQLALGQPPKEIPAARV
jgi:hypothetical protein